MPERDYLSNGRGIARMLAERGIARVFGIPDGHSLDFYDGLLETNGIEHVLVNDERTAAFAADAYARVTGMPGACDAGAAGALNMPVALAEAMGSSSPVIAIVATVKQRDVLLNVPHDVDIASVLRPVTKWTGVAAVADHVPRFMEHAIRQSINGRPGPAAIVIPEDVLSSTDNLARDFSIDGRHGACAINGCRAAPAPGEIDDAIELIARATQPAIIAGGGAVQSRAFAAVATLARRLHAPVFSTITGKGIMLPGDDSFYLGTIGLFGEAPNNKFLRKHADLVIVLGSRLTEDDTANFKYPPERATMIQVDVDPSEIGKRYHPIGIVGDVRVAVDAMLAGLDRLAPRMDLTSRAAKLDALRVEHAAYREKDAARWARADPIKPQRVLQAIARELGSHDYLVTDASASSRWIGPYFPARGLGRRIITPRGVGPTGFGLGALLGTCVATNTFPEPGERCKVVLLTGDGGLMNAGTSDLETITRLDLDCTIVVLNNKALGFVKFGQLSRTIYETERPDTDFARIAEAHGGTGTRVDQLAGLDQAIHDAISARDGLALVDVRVDPAELLPPSFY